MSKVLVTGSEGFIGQNLISNLKNIDDIEIVTFDEDDDFSVLEDRLREVDVVYHLAGVNRPKNDEEFNEGNYGLTNDICKILTESGNKPRIIFTSSIQADLDNPYGQSKKAAEDALIGFSETTGTPVCIYRLPNVFGKWSKPNYNTVVATLCSKIQRDEEYQISDPENKITFVYIDNVVFEFINQLNSEKGVDQKFYTIEKTHRVKLGTLVQKLLEFKASRETKFVPDFCDEFTRYLYATYISFSPKTSFAADVKKHQDERGELFELIKSKQFGQIFVSSTNPNFTRGNHYHNTKIEKFCLIKGNGVIRFRNVLNEEIIEYKVNGQNIQIVDIPPGYTHSIENVGKDEMIVLFWANEIFDPNNADTYFDEVLI